MPPASTTQLRTAPVADPVPAVKAVLDTLPTVHRAFLFGSRSRGDHMARADCDIAIEAPGAGATEWAAILEALDNARTLIPLDVTRLDEAEAGLREEIPAQRKAHP